RAVGGRRGPRGWHTGGLPRVRGGDPRAPHRAAAGVGRRGGVKLHAKRFVTALTALGLVFAAVGTAAAQTTTKPKTKPTTTTAATRPPAPRRPPSSWSRTACSPWCPP